MAIKKVRKRSGEIVDFDRKKIEEAIIKGMKAVNFPYEKMESEAKRMTDEVIEELEKKYTLPSVEEIQDVVEKILIKNNYAELAKAYILYRKQHEQLRKTMALLEGIEPVDDYIEQRDWFVKENANMNYSLQGLNNYITTKIISRYWLEKIYPPEVKKAHVEGDMHVHNLGTLGPYCVGWDLRDLLMSGITGVSGKIESKPAKHFRALLGQIVNFMYTLQGEAAGAIAFSNFDTYIAPFVKYDNLSYKEVKQAMQEFIFNMNVPTRVGFQTPFTNLTLDLKIPEFMKNEQVIIGGNLSDEVYGDFEEEIKMVNKAFAEVMSEGDAKGRVFTFPIPTYNITKDFDFENSDYDEIWEMTAKYGIPYFANFVNSDMKPEDVRSMCLDAKEEILIRNSKKIKRLSIKEVVENYKLGEFDKEGWAECNKEKQLEVLSLNPKTFRTEWSRVKRFLKVLDNEAVEIETEDGKKAVFSSKHPVPVFTEKGLTMKFSKDVKEGDYLLSLKNANDNLSKRYQKISDSLILDEDLAKILGYFVADGNYLFRNKGYREPRGIQFTFKTGDKENLQTIRELIKKVFKLNCKEKQDPRYNTYHLYLYSTKISKTLYNAGFKKHGRLPQVLFNSPPSVIKSFLEFYFRGDGYKKRQEIHINDFELSRDLVLLYSLIGQPVTYKLLKKSQRIYLQHSKSEVKANGWLNNPIIAERVPGWMAASTFKVPGLTKSKMVGFGALEKYNAHTEQSLKIKESSIYLVRVKNVKKMIFKEAKEFYDLELEKNHLFVHSLGQISFNCCRLRLDTRELKKRGGGLFGANPLTGSIGVFTINMPRIGYLAKDDSDFFERLERMMEIAKTGLEVKRKALERLTEKGLYPYSKFYLRMIKQTFGGYWSNHFSTIGLIGMNEACLNFLGENIASEQGRSFAIKVLDFMRKKLEDFQLETQHIYNLEATPAESTSYDLARKDKEKFKDIIVANEEAYRKGAEPYYTNSSQLPVGYSDDIFEVLKLQDELQIRYTGGTVIHIFLGESSPSKESVKRIVKKVTSNFRLPYFTLTPTFSICPIHGYIKGKHEYCPICEQKGIKTECEVYSRIVGYLRPVKQWNPGKQEEFKDRKVFDKSVFEV
ncbi:MAG: ribonucleoside triphosphate reductase [Candidatus Micrarchaeia archaeon]